jgi:hypothetical protein
MQWEFEDSFVHPLVLLYFLHLYYEFSVWDVVVPILVRRGWHA